MRRLFPLLFLVLSAGIARSAGPVVIAEVYYHPPSSEGEVAEFVELENISGADVSLAGWRLAGAARFTVGAGVTLPPGGRFVICRDCEALRDLFGGTAAGFLGNFEGALDNGKETVDLVDGGGAIVDSVPYRDDFPWPAGPDGDGASLQRTCREASGRDPAAWSGDGRPTPGKAGPAESCPPAPQPAPRVAITEIHFHPDSGPFEYPAVEDGEDEEFVELRNLTGAAIAVGGWRLTDGIEFALPAGTTIPSGGYLVVCRDPVVVAARYGITTAVGGYAGKLSNRGERIALVDSTGRTVDAVTWSDGGDWPYAADGFGPSLERIVDSLPGDDPANWAPSRLVSSPDFLFLSREGGAGSAIARKLVLSIDGVGEALIDDVRLVDLAAPETNLVTNGDFESGLQDWDLVGNAATSTIDPAAGVGRSSALHLRSNGSCAGGDCGVTHGAVQSVAGLVAGRRYRFEVRYRYLSGSQLFRGGVPRGAEVVARNFPSPGRPNSAAAAVLPPFISRVGRFPLEPRSGDPTAITAHVRAEASPVVTLSWDAGSGVSEVAMEDDGLHSDGLPGDGIFGAILPPQPHDSQVVFSIRAIAGGVSAEVPRALTPASRLESEHFGYYVNDLRPDSPLPVWHLLIEGIDPTNPQDVNDPARGLDCFNLETAAFAEGGTLYPGVGVRFRGNTACYLQKRNFKVVFPRIAPFHGQRKINLNSQWTDKAMVREHLAWEFLREIGGPYMRTEYVRLHLNGAFHGLFLSLEHPDGRFLDRVGLDGGGNLYKAKQPQRLPNQDPIGVEVQLTPEAYRTTWEAETNESGDYSDLVEFIGAMHADGKAIGGPTAEFWETRILEDTIITYQLAQSVLDNIDSFAKNHFLHHDLRSDRWAFITWDLDLTFGKFFSLDAVRFPERPVGTLNDLMLSDLGFDLNPWFGATVLGNPRYNWLVDFFFRAGTGRYQRAYLVRLRDILADKFRNETYDGILDDLADRIAVDDQDDYDRWGRYVSNVVGFPDRMRAPVPADRDNLDIVKSQIRLHRSYLQRYLQSWHSTIKSVPRMKITEILYLPEGGDDDLEFIEIVNSSEGVVDVSGWSIPAVGFVFPAGSEVAPGTTFVVARSPAALLARHPDLPSSLVFGPYPGKLANEGEDLRLLDGGPGYPATIDRVGYETGGEWPLLRPGRSIELTQPAPDRDNDRGGNWRASGPGGSPGRAAGRFVRSDSNGDGSVNLTDAVFLLAHLFQGGPQPPCSDAADANDDGRIDIADPIVLLGHLFLGGTAPPSPFPQEGLDPTSDALDCRS